MIVSKLGLSEQGFGLNLSRVPGDPEGKFPWRTGKFIKEAGQALCDEGAVARGVDKIDAKAFSKSQETKGSPAVMILRLRRNGK